jgi:hypothetical protein
MKKFFFAVLLLLPFALFAQTPEIYYVAFKTGLSIRDKADVNGKVIDKIPYGTKITLLPYEENPQVHTEGMTGSWRKVKYNNKTGYIIDSYLFLYPPPKSTVKDLKSYLTQLSLPFGTKLVVKSGKMNNIEFGGWEMQKQLYKNGAEWHRYIAYEYDSDTYFLPDFTTQQAFVLLRLIPEFSAVFGEKDVFPTEDKIIKRGDDEFAIKVDKEMIGDTPWIKRIRIEYADGAMYFFELYQIDSQVVIFYGSGV